MQNHELAAEAVAADVQGHAGHLLTDHFDGQCFSKGRVGACFYAQRAHEEQHGARLLGPMTQHLELMAVVGTHRPTSKGRLG